jgi:hypothetical protein
VSWYVAAISKQSPHNWEMCKEVGLFGISTQGRKISVSNIQSGDKILVWLGGKGFISRATIKSSPRPPIDKSEVPWGGGIYRFGLVIPISVDLEAQNPIWLGFQNGKQIETGMSQFALRKSFSLIPDSVALKIDLLLKKSQIN